MNQGSLSLTRNQALVFDTLSSCGSPLSAYAILDAVRDRGMRAPAQVYRALDKLVDSGLIHRLETLNAYVACSHSHRHRGSTVFAICNACGEVCEYADRMTGDQLAQRALEEGFAVDTAIVELRGLCQRCSRGGGTNDQPRD